VLANKPDDFVPLNLDLPNLEFGQVSPVVVITTIQSFETKASTDLEGISSKLLIRIAVEILNPGVHIFNLSIQTGVFPERLKTSRTVHIYKAGKKDLCDNYKPISLLSSLSKILEKS
jgi:hypothetical protein